MDFYEVVNTRRSVRAHLDKPIPAGVLERVLTAPRMAPSGSNRQPTRFALVKDPGARRQFAQLCGERSFIAQAPIVVVGLGGNINWNRGGYMRHLATLVDVSIAFDHLTLAARTKSLGTCWIGSFDNQKITTFIGAPTNCNVVAVTPLGYPQGEPFVPTTDRLPLSNLVCNERWTL